MPKISFITPQVAVAGALTPDDFAEIARLGFRSIINNRPDDEEAGQLTAAKAAKLAEAAGLAYRHVPAAKLDLFTDLVLENMADALTSLEGPVLAHCKSGLRSAIAWAATQVPERGVEHVLAKTRSAGFDLEPIRDEFEDIAGGAAA